jgi:hypothetical protein
MVPLADIERQFRMESAFPPIDIFGTACRYDDSVPAIDAKHAITLPSFEKADSWTLAVDFLTSKSCPIPGSVLPYIETTLYLLQSEKTQHALSGLASIELQFVGSAWLVLYNGDAGGKKRMILETTAVCTSHRKFERFVCVSDHETRRVRRTFVILFLLFLFSATGVFPSSFLAMLNADNGSSTVFSVLSFAFYVCTVAFATALYYYHARHCTSTALKYGTSTCIHHAIDDRSI